MWRTARSRCMPATPPNHRLSPTKSSTAGPTRSWTTPRSRSAAHARLPPAAPYPRAPAISAVWTRPRSNGVVEGGLATAPRRRGSPRRPSRPRRHRRHRGRQLEPLALRTERPRPNAAQMRKVDGSNPLVRRRERGCACEPFSAPTPFPTSNSRPAQPSRWPTAKQPAACYCADTPRSADQPLPMNWRAAAA